MMTGRIVKRKYSKVIGLIVVRIATKTDMGQTDLGYDGAWARINRSNSGMGQTEQCERNFVQTMSSVAPDHPVRDPGSSGPYLSWAQDFQLCIFMPYDFQLLIRLMM